MTRNRLVLLAAALVLVIGISVVISTRLFTAKTNTINVNHSQVTLQQLLARPLQIKTIAATAKCPNGPEDQSNATYGAGPIYERPGPPANSAWGQYGDVTILTPLGDKDVIIQRAIDVRTGEPMVFLPPFGYGPVLRTDTVNGKTLNQYTVGVIDTAHPPSIAVLNSYGLAGVFQTQYKGSTYLAWSWWQGIPNDSSLCLGYQIDGPDFSEVIYSTPGNY